MNKLPLLALLLPAVAHAGTSYDLTVHLLAPTAPPRTVQRYFVEGSMVRIGGRDSKQFVILNDKTLYFIDTAARTVRVNEHSSLAEVAAAMTASQQRMRESTTKLPPEKRASAQDVATALAEDIARRVQPEPSDYVITTRSETIGGHRCVIWERIRNNMKLREICVAPVNEVPGGADIFAGLKTLSDSYMGSLFALGVNFGLAPWWTSIESLGGVPLLVREFYPTGGAGYESTLTGMRHEPPDPSLFEIPDGYQTIKDDGPAQQLAH